MDKAVKTNASQPVTQYGSQLAGNQKQGNVKKLFLGIVAGMSVLMLTFLVLDHFKIISLRALPLPFTETSLGKAPTVTIATVGRETLYQKDLDTELTYYPPQQNIDREKQLIQKIIKDSITLQAAAKDGLITLDATVFNSQKKDYSKRLQLVSEVQKIIDTRRDTLSGEVIAIWFYNGKAGEMGYEAGRSLALAKITKLRSDVAGRKITVKQAAQQIQNDTSLQKVDPAYKSNALFTFAVGPDEKIVFEPGFSEIIKKLQVGQVTEVYTAKDKELVNGNLTGKKIDAVYMFAQLTERKISDNPGFSTWYAQNAPAYEISYE